MNKPPDIRPDPHPDSTRDLTRPVVRWARGLMADPQRLLLAAMIVGLIAALWLVGGVLAPILASIVIAYLVDGPVEALTRRGVSRMLCAALFTLAFVAALATVLLVLAPLLLSQVAEFARSLPTIFSEIQALVLALAAENPGLIDDEQVRDLATRLNREVVGLGQTMIYYSVAQLPTLATVGIYVFILPLLVFFFIRDKPMLLGWAARFLPENRPLAERVWTEISFKIGGYVRGKVYEMLIVGAASYALFAAFGVDYAALLAVLSGASVLIPYFGAPMAGVPLALVGFAQWGLSSELAYLILAYAILQTIDGTILGTLLLAGAVNLHPIAVMVAIFIFGDLYGFWGLFFAVPLASAVQVVMAAWAHGAATWPDRSAPEHNDRFTFGTGG